MKDSCQNSFSAKDGMVTDLNPLVVPNTAMTSCLNGTFYTYNGNEGQLQNDMGNGRVESAKLPAGYVPIGIKEFGGIVYVVSHNPVKNESQIGSFPSPERNIAINNMGSDSSLNVNEWDFRRKTNGDSTNPFYPEEGYNLFYQKLLIMSDKIIRSGDSFSVLVTKDSSLGNIIGYDNSKKIKYDGDGNVISNPDPNGINGDIIIRLAVIDSSNALIYVDDSLIKDPNTKSWLTEVESFPNSDAELSVDSWEQTINSGHIYNGPTGTLVLTVELSRIDNFNVTYKVNKATDSDLYNVEFTIKNNYSNMPENSIVRLEGSEFEYNITNSNIVSESGNTVINIINTSNSEKITSGNINVNNFISSNILDYYFTPYDKWAYNSRLKVNGQIDFSKIGTNAINIDTWKYLVEDDKISIFYGIEHYLLDEYRISEVKFTFLDYYIPGTYVYTTPYICAPQETFNGRFTEVIPFGRALGSTVDTTPFSLAKNNFYAVRIDIKVIDTTNEDKEVDLLSKIFLKTLYTSTIFNSYYYNYLSEDFSTINLNTNIISSMNTIENDTIEDITIPNGYKVIGDINVNSTNLNVENYKSMKIYDFKATSKLEITHGLDLEELYPFIVNNNCIINSLDEFGTVGNYFKLDINNTDNGGLTNGLNNIFNDDSVEFIKLSNTPLNESPQTYSSDLPTVYPDINNKYINHESFSMKSEYIDGKESGKFYNNRLDLVSNGRISRKSTAALDNRDINYTGSILESFFNEETIYNDSVPNPNFPTQRGVTEEGCARFGYRVISNSANRDDEAISEVSIFRWTSPRNGEKDNNGAGGDTRFSYQGYVEAGTANGDLTEAEQGDLETYLNRSSSENMNKKAVIYLIGGLEDADESGYAPNAPRQDPSGSDYQSAKDYGLNSSHKNYTFIRNYIPVFNKTPRYIRNSTYGRWIFLGWKHFNGNTYYINFLGLRESWSNDLSEMHKAIRQITRNIFLVQKRVNKVIKINFIEEYTSSIDYNTIFNINFGIKKSLKENQPFHSDYYLYKINNNCFEIDNSGNFNNNIKLKLELPWTPTNEELSNIPNRSTTIFKSYNNDIYTYKKSYNIGNNSEYVLSINDMDTYYKNLQSSMIDGSVDLVPLDGNNTSCKRSQVYLLCPDGKYYSCETDNQFIREYDFGWNYPRTTFNSIPYKINMLNKFTVDDPNKEFDDVHPVLSNQVSPKFNEAGWGTIGNGNMNFAPLVLKQEFFKAYSLMNQ